MFRRAAALNFKPGAGGAIGAGFVAGSKPDGYTLVGTSIGSVVLGPLADKDSKFALDSFTPVVAFAEGNLMRCSAAMCRWLPRQQAPPRRTSSRVRCARSPFTATYA